MLACASGVRFSPALPPGLPDVTGWETRSATVELTNPPTRLEYQLLVDPGRPAVYSVTRYRFTPRDASRAAHEKLQWDRNGVDVRRYACVPQPAAPGGPCRWEELLRGSAAYDLELVPLLRVYDTHRKMSNRRQRR
jgi:hypothetical protein